jgi:hypothetical protein
VSGRYKTLRGHVVVGVASNPIIAVFKANENGDVEALKALPTLGSYWK